MHALETATLGDPIAQYRSSQVGHYLIIAFFACGSIFIAWLSFSQGSPSVPLLLFALLELGCAIGFAVLVWYRPYHLRMFDHGMLVERHAGSVVLLWETFRQIELTTDSSHGHTFVNVTLEHNRGKPIQIRATLGKPAKPDPSDLVPHKTIEQAIDIIVEATQAYRLQLAQARYRAGERVDFKKLQVSAEGLRVKRSILPWTQVASLMTDEDVRMLTITRVGQSRPWKVVWIEQIPNKDILAPLIAGYQPQLVAPLPEAITRSEGE